MTSTQGIRAGRAFVEIFADDSKLVRGLKAAQAKLKNFGASVRAMGTKLMAAGAAVAAPLAGMSKTFSDMGDHIAKMAARTGISVESLSELAYAADLSGTSLEGLETGVRKMQKTLVNAAAGSSSAQDALKMLGLTIKDLDGMSPEQQFKKIADRISQIEDPTVRAAAAMEVFGRSGTELLPMMYAFSETHYLSLAAVTDAYKQALFNLTGKVNSGPFRGLAAGECLFLGASGSQRGDSDWEITFKFAGSPNKASIAVGSRVVFCVGVAEYPRSLPRLLGQSIFLCESGNG